MTALAFFIGIVIGVIIGYLIGNNSKPQVTEDKSPDFDFSDQEIDEINKDLLDSQGRFRFKNDVTGESMRFISFMDSLLLNLSPSNNFLITESTKNQETAIKLLEVKKKRDNDGEGFSPKEVQEILAQIREGKPIQPNRLVETCPPSNRLPSPEWWSGEHGKSVPNLSRKQDVEVSLVDPNGNIFTVPFIDSAYDFTSIINNNNPGIFTIRYKITDLELGKTSSFEQKFHGRADSK